MVNPRVLVACGVDPDRYSGFVVDETGAAAKPGPGDWRYALPPRRYRLTVS